MNVIQAGKIGSKGETNSCDRLKVRFLATENWQSVTWCACSCCVATAAQSADGSVPQLASSACHLAGA